MNVSEMFEVAKVMEIPHESDTSARSIDYQRFCLLRAEALASKLQKQLEKVDLSVLKKGFAAASERPEDMKRHGIC